MTAAAGIGTAVLFICLTVMTRLEIKQKKDLNYIIEIDDARAVNDLISYIKSVFPQSHNFDIFPAKSNIAGHVDISVNIGDAALQDIEKLKQSPHVVFVLGE